MSIIETCRSAAGLHKQPHGLTKSLPEIHTAILFDRAVTAQLYCPKKVKLTAYSSPTLSAVDQEGNLLEGIEPQSYRYLPSKKDITSYAEAVGEKLGDISFDIVTRDALNCFENGRARIGGMPAEPTGEFSSVLIYRHRPEEANNAFLMMQLHEPNTWP